MNDLKKALKPQQSIIENMQTIINVSNLENRTKILILITISSNHLKESMFVCFDLFMLLNMLHFPVSYKC